MSKGYSDYDRLLVIDTNVLMGAGDKVFSCYSNSIIAIPAEVIQVLERHLSDRDGYGRTCKSIIDRVDCLRRDNPNCLHYGVKLENNNLLIVRPALNGSLLPTSNLVIELAKILEEEQLIDPRNIVIISNSISTRLEADSHSICASQFESSYTKPFNGWVKITVDIPHPSDNTDELVRATEESCRQLDNYNGVIARRSAVQLSYNDGAIEYLLLNDGSFHSLIPDIRALNVRPRPGNMEQAIALHYLMDESVRVVTLGGIAGAGKTLLSLAAGIAQYKDDKYEQICVYRPMYTLQQQDTGFLPGTLEEKMIPWARPVWSCIDRIDKINNFVIKDNDDIPRPVQERHPEIRVEPISFLRGETLSNSFIIVDDAQSLERVTILDIISRMGKGSKIVFTYDMTQQDNRFLSTGTSITSLIEDLTDCSEHAHIDFTRSERSKIAQLAGDLLANSQVVK